LDDPIDPKEVSESIRILNNQVELRNKIANNGFKKSTKINWESAKDQTLKSYNNTSKNNKFINYRLIEKLISGITNRKIRRKISDVTYKTLLPKKKYHLIDTLPEMELSLYPENWSVQFKNHFKGTIPKKYTFPKESEINLIGSGPSISNQNFSSLQDKPVVLMNGTISLCSSYKFNKLYYVVIDSTFIANRFDLIKNNIPDNATIFLTPGVLHCILEFDNSFMKDRKIIIIENIQEKYLENKKTINKVSEKNIVVENSSGISLNINNGYFNGGTVMYTAAQIALSFNPASIFFFGFDIGNSGQPRFNENKNNKLKSGLLKDYGVIVSSMSLFSNVCQKRNIDIRNYSIISCLPEEIIKKYNFTPEELLE